MNLSNLAFWCGALAAGLSAAVVAYVLLYSVLQMTPDDRSWRDPPPKAWRPIWGLVRWLEPAVRRLLPAPSVQRLGQVLQRAGLEFSVRPSEFRSVQAAHALLASAGAGTSVAMLFVTASAGAVGLAACVGAAVGWTWPRLLLRERSDRRRAELVRALPFCLDVITLCVEAGLNLQGALAQAVAKGPGGCLRDELQRCLRDIRAGMGRADALARMADRVAEPGLSQFVTAVVQAEALGMSLGPVLRAQADQRRSERFLRAEKLAMQAPVKLLLPLIACIFPCTFIVLFFPIAMKLLQPGL